MSGLLAADGSLQDPISRQVVEQHCWFKGVVLCRGYDGARNHEQGRYPDSPHHFLYIALNPAIGWR
jgi:hypothetical protein